MKFHAVYKNESGIFLKCNSIIYGTIFQIKIVGICLRSSLPREINNRIEACMSDLVGSIVAERYRVDQFLGRGGMADVYKVWDSQRAAALAMKVLHENLAEDQVFLRRFRREAQNLAKLKHPNIVRFYELDQDGELVFMIMEYVDGVTLSKARSRSQSPFTPGQTLSIIQPICSALHLDRKSVV